MTEISSNLEPSSEWSANTQAFTSPAWWHIACPGSFAGQKAWKQCQWLEQRSPVCTDVQPSQEAVDYSMAQHFDKVLQASG